LWWAVVRVVVVYLAGAVVLVDSEQARACLLQQGLITP
jgi:hypothetical protein